jgi:hypothetical protein
MGMSPAQLLIAQDRVGFRSQEPVLSRWIRELRALVSFPVTFRSSLDRVPFMIISILILFYAMAPGNHDDNGYGAALQLMKYMFAIFFLSWFALLALTRQRINTSPLFPLAALALSVAGVFSFTYSIAVEPGTTTYSSALIPLILLALPLVIRTLATQADGATVAKYLFRIIGISAIFHVLWYLVDYASGISEADPGSYTGIAPAFAPVCLMILSGLFRRKILLAISVGLIGLSLVLRPSSTTGFIAIFATAVIVLYRLNYWRLVQVGYVFIVGMIILGNLAAFISEDVAERLYSIDPLMKEDLLDATSNSKFRLAITRAVRDEIAERSILVGKFFSGDVNVNFSKYYSWGSPVAPIHSEYVVMIQQGGLIGYGLLTSLFMGLALFWAKGARVAHAAGDVPSETLFSAAQAINITYMLVVTGSPLLGDLKNSLPYLTLILLTVFLARAQPGFADRRHRGATRYRRPSNPYRISQV